MNKMLNRQRILEGRVLERIDLFILITLVILLTLFSFKESVFALSRKTEVILRLKIVTATQTVPGIFDWAVPKVGAFVPSNVFNSIITQTIRLWEEACKKLIFVFGTPKDIADLEATVSRLETAISVLSSLY